ncbi:MAG: sulfite reductase, partial [Xanthomonadaceae bacterium]|nr:sulfite reductase [Xanthomonadaceae bacterium]
MPSHLEDIKTVSRFLRGTIAAGLADPVTGAISEDDNKLLKFHGSYQQDDRDLRDERRRQKLE